MTSEPDSFARRALQARKPQIARQVIEDNQYPHGIVRSVEQLIAEMAAGPMRPLSEDAPDVDFWNTELATAWPGKGWLEVGWYFAETFFYRRLLEAVRYLQPGPWEGHDPFGSQKRAQDRAALAWLAETWEPSALPADPRALESLLHLSLWGNRGDLSNVAINARAQRGLVLAEERRNLLVDDTQRALALISSRLKRLDFVSDNAGMDLLADLALADFLLVHGWAARVVFHLKERPFYVSDAMIADAEALLVLLQLEPEGPVHDLGIRLAREREMGQLMLRTSSPADRPYWTSYLGFRRLPTELRADLRQSELVILKGDVNYRRLLDDRHWPYTARIEDAAGHFPTACLVLRTLKGEIIVGLQPGQAEVLGAEDPNWLTNGRRGIVQLLARGD